MNKESKRKQKTKKIFFMKGYGEIYGEDYEARYV